MNAGRWGKRTCAAGLAAYFCWCSRDVPRVRFAPDDLMNLDYYWRLGPWQLLRLFLEPWRGGYRPMAGLFYKPMLALFGLNPAPYHLVILTVLLAGVYLVYRFARALGASETASFLAAFAACYHAGLSRLYYDTSFIYDVLCWFFYLAAFVYYAGVRSAGRRLSAREMAIFLGLFLCALNSKEMAVTLPVVLVAYEWLYQKRPDWRAAVFGAALNLPLVYAVLLGPNSLARNPMYRPEFSFGRVAAFQQAAFADLFEAWHFFDLPRLVAVWALVTLLSWVGSRPAPRFCWWFLVLTPLPLELLRGRTAACLAIPFCGLALLAAIRIEDAATGLSRLWRAPGVRRAAFASTIAAAVVLWAWQNARLKRQFIQAQMRDLGQETWSMITQLRALHPRVEPHSTVVFLNDPFEGFDMAFIAELSFRQSDLNIRLQAKTPLSAEELSRADHLFRYEMGQLVQIR